MVDVLNSTGLVWCQISHLSVSTFNPFPVFQNSFGNIRIVSVQLLIHVAVKVVDTKLSIYVLDWYA